VSPTRRDDISEIKQATLTPGGSIVVTLDDDHRDVTIADLRLNHTHLIEQIRDELATSVDDLEQRLAASQVMAHRASQSALEHRFGHLVEQPVDPVDRGAGGARVGERRIDRLGLQRRREPARRPRHQPPPTGDLRRSP
jgi:hypothetical protein